jgi:hypothetical protein
MLAAFIGWLWARLHVGQYEPQEVTFATIRAWLSQFSAAERLLLLRVLRKIIYISEPELRRRLVSLNQKLTEHLLSSGIPLRNIVYVSIDEAGSSSGMILHKLRNAARLGGKGPRFLDSKDTRGLADVTNELGEGAIVYVDDFCASGTQFCSSRDFAQQFFVGNFTEFFLVPSICEEAIPRLKKRRVEERTDHIHTQKERPLLVESGTLSVKTRQRLIDLSNKIDPASGLGFQDMATMVIVYHNAPDTLPALFRGNVGQKPYVGIFPQITELPDR